MSKSLNFRFWPWFGCSLFALFCLVACVPVTTAELEVGTGCSEDHLKKVELIVEQADFSRQSMFVDNREFARLEKDGVVYAKFVSRSTPGIVVRVELHKTGGKLNLLFQEYNTEFSVRSLVILRHLTRGLRNGLAKDITATLGGKQLDI